MLWRNAVDLIRRGWRAAMYLDHLHERQWMDNLSPRRVKSLFLEDFGGFSGFVEAMG